MLICANPDFASVSGGDLVGHVFQKTVVGASGSLTESILNSRYFGAVAPPVTKLQC